MKKDYGIKTYNKNGELIEPWCEIWVGVKHYYDEARNIIVVRRGIIETKGSPQDFVDGCANIVYRYIV